MSTSKIVWFYGPSAVGKETTINNILNDPEHFLIKHLGLQPKIVVNKNSLELIHDDRLGIEEEIAREAAEYSTVLLKGQGDDIAKLDIPQKLKVLLPEHEHIFLYIDAVKENLTKRRFERDGLNEWQWDTFNDRLANIQLAKKLEGEGVSFVWLNNDTVLKLIGKSDIPGY